MVGPTANLRKYLTLTFAAPVFALTLEPETAHLSPSGNAGYTTGSY